MFTETKVNDCFIIYNVYFSWKACYLVDLTPNLVDVTSQTMRHYNVTSQTMRHYLKRRHHPCDIKYCRLHVIRLWTNEMAFIYILYNKKCYWTVNFILTDAKRWSIWIVYCSITLHVHRSKSQHLFYYIKRYFSRKVWHLRQISVDVP